jgi:hypothetical protein
MGGERRAAVGWHPVRGMDVPERTIERDEVVDTGLRYT